MNIIVGDNIDLETIVKWGKPKEVQTSRGVRYLSKAKLKAENDPFWDLWRDNKSAMQAAGISVSKDQYTNDWVACRWRELPAEELERRAKSVEQSRATDADIEIPAPEGCVPLPFQRAGVKYILEKWGEKIVEK